MAEKVTLRPAKLQDLDDINRVIEAAVQSWDLPERVKRLSLFSYRYTEVDFDHLEMIVAEIDTLGIIGVAAWEMADAKDAPSGKRALLLHGIYVVPSMHDHGTPISGTGAAGQGTGWRERFLSCHGHATPC
jgi:hypothetical protein